MTQPDSFNDFSAALRMREVIAKVVREEMARQRPPARYGKVYDFNRFAFTSDVQFPGDVETTRVKFPPSLQPVRRIVADGDLFADVVRVEGVPGNLWITDIVNGPAFQDETKLHLPSLRGGTFMHQQVAKFFGGSSGDLPALNEAWYVGKWTNTTSFGSDGLAHIEVVVRHSFFSSVTKKYEMALRSNDTQGNWKKCAPVFDSGPWSSNDFELEVKTGGDSVELRIRRTMLNSGGFTPGGYNADVWFYGEDWEQDYTAIPGITADPAPNRFHGTTSSSAEAKGPFLSPAMHASRNAQNVLMGGGAVTYNNSLGILKWSRRFLVMGAGRSHLIPGGYFEIPVPVGTTGGAIPVYGKTGTDTTDTVAGGIWLGDWDALYYELHWGEGASPVGPETNFRIVNFDDANKKFQVPSHWVFIALKGGDNPAFQYVKLGTGESIDYAHDLSLVSGYASLGFPWATPAYRAIQGNRIGLEGIVKTTAAKAADSTIATLATHLRPSVPLMFTAKTDTGFSNIVVTETGIIRHGAALASGGWVSLDGITFPRGQ